MNLTNDTIRLSVSFLVQLAATLIGVFLAFELESCRERRTEKKNKRQILVALKQELGVNIHQLIPTITKNLEEMRVPFAPLSFEIWDAIPNKIALVPEHALGVIGNAYYNLRSLEKALDRFGDYAHGYLSASDAKVRQDFNDRIKSVVDVILDHVREPKNENESNGPCNH
jgi:hypothetical protein